MKTYAIHSCFYSLQGEGAHAGTPAVFLRFAGCNVWSGREEDREEAARERGCCAAWCDTEFRGGKKLTGDEIVTACLKAAGYGTVERPWSLAYEGRRLIVVCTGGEPGLQLDEGLVRRLRVAGFVVHVETNGSRPIPGAVEWVTLSPKPPMDVVLHPDAINEIKVIYPDVDPLGWHRWSPRVPIYIQPRDDNDGLELRGQRWQEAVEYVLANPWARLSLQQHKLLGIE